MDRRSCAVVAVVLAVVAGVPTRGTAQVAPDTVRLGRLVVTATRLPLPRAAVPAAVTVLPGDELRARGVRYVAEALREVPGLMVVRGGSTGALTSLFLRGGESDYVQVLIDGVQVNDPGGTFNIAHLTTDDIERIEVVRGPVSVVWGSDAVTGAVQIFTRRGRGASRLEATAGAGRSARVGDRARGGSGSFDASAAVSGGSARAAYAFSAARHTTDGVQAFNNDHASTTFSGRLELRPDVRTAAALSARWTDGRFHYPTNGAGALVDANQYRASENLAVGLEAGRALSSMLEAHLSLSASTGDYRTVDDPDGPADTLGGFAFYSTDDVSRRAADLRVDLRPARALVLTLGSEIERQRAASTIRSESSFGPFQDGSENERSSRAVYAQLIAHATAFTFTAGARLDDNDRFGTFGTWRAGVNWHAAGGLVLRAAAGTGFKEPTFFENYASGFARGNPALEPERSRNLEAGAEQALLDGRLALGATVFTQRFEDLIQYTGSPPAAGDPNYFNIAAAGASGIEMSARWSDRAGVQAAASWEHIRTRVTNAGFGGDRAFLDDRPLLRRPKHRAVVRAGWQATRWNAGLALSRVGRRDDLDFSDPVEFAGIRVVLPAYTTVDVHGGLALLRRGGAPDLDLIVRIENLLDARYTEIANFPALPRSLFMGLRAGLGL